MPNLAQNLADTARKFPDRPALRLGTTTLTYAQFEALAGKAAARMAALGVGVGDRVGLMLPNVFEFPVLFYGALRIGAVAVPMNPLLKGREITHYCGDSGMKLLWAHEMVADADLAQAPEGVIVQKIGTGLVPELAAEDTAAPAYVDRDDSDTAVILYTSGTTGSPKGAELTNGGLNKNLHVVIEDLMDIGENDVIVGCLPLFHVFGLTCSLNSGVAAGALLTLIPRFDPQVVLEAIARDQATIFQGVPTMYTAMAALPDADPTAVATLRICCSGGASLPAEVVRAFEGRFGAKILEGYGLSETSPVASFNRVEQAKKDMIIRGGYNIYPREIEEVLYEHRAVREAAVLGVPHPTHGEEVGAAVSLKPGAEVTADELREYVKERVAADKYPRVVWFLDDLPKGATGKILKRSIERPQD